MSISNEVQEFINTSLAQNNAALLGQISKLVADSAENIKRSSVEAADEQLREIKRLRREEPKSFKRKGNEIRYKFNSKLQDTLEEAKSHFEVNAVEKVKASLSEGSWRNQNERLPFTLSSSFPSRNGNCFACGKFGHWRSECPQTQRSGSKGNLSGNR